MKPTMRTALRKSIEGRRITSASIWAAHQYPGGGIVATLEELALDDGRVLHFIDDANEVRFWISEEGMVDHDD